MRLCWKFLRLTVVAALPLAVVGCGGINASHRVSPASFFLPGLIKNDTPTNFPALTPTNPTELAIAR